MAARVRQVLIDLDPVALQSKGLSAQDVSNAIAAQNQILPAGTIKIGTYQYNVRLNNSAATIEELNNLPIKTVGGATIYIRDVGLGARRLAAPDQRRARATAARAVLSTILKNGSASTLAIVDGRQGAPADPEGDPARRVQHRAAERPVAVREGRDRQG